MKIRDILEGYTVLPPIDKEKYQARDGLEGPFRLKNSKVVYYDPQEGKYYDPDTDMYIDYDDYRKMDEQNSKTGYGKPDRPGYVVKAADKPKTVKPNTGGSSKHPYQGKLVGATEAEEPKADTSSREKLNRSLVAQGHRVEKDRKKAAKRGEVKHKGQIEEGPLAKVAGAAAMLAALGIAMPDGKDTPLGVELAKAANAGDSVAAYHLDNLDGYIETDDQRTLVNLRIAYIDDSPRQDVKAYLAKKAQKSDSILKQIGWSESKKKITKSNDPCWNGYHMVGTKTKNGKEVPNCVPGKKG